MGTEERGKKRFLGEEGREWGKRERGGQHLYYYKGRS